MGNIGDNMIGNRNIHFKLPIIVFQINSISLIRSEEFGENSLTKTKAWLSVETKML